MNWKQWILGYCLLAVAASSLAHADEPAPIVAGPQQMLQGVVALADAGKFDEVEPLLAVLERSHRTSDARFAAGLYAAQQAYSHGDCKRAKGWLQQLTPSATIRIKPVVQDALAWCDVDPCDLEVPSARLLEMAEKHALSSFAPAALALRAEKLASAKRPDEALFVYHAALARFPQAPQSPAMMLATARLHRTLCQHSEAIEWLEQLVEGHGECQEIDDALYFGVFVAREANDAGRSRSWLERLITNHADSPYWCDAAYRLAALQVAEGAHGEAESLIARVVDHAVTTKDIRDRALFLRVQMAIEAGEWAGIEKHAADLLAASPAEPLKHLAQFWQAEASYRDKDYDLAHQRFTDLLLISAKEKDDWLGLVPLRLAQLEARRQRWGAALELADELVRQRPEFSRIHEVDYLRGRCLSSQARFSEAREAFGRVIDSESAAASETAAMAQWMIGETFFLQKRYEDAIAAYEKTSTCDFRQWRAAALLQSAKCCEQLGRFDDAAGRYQRVVTEHAETQFVAEANSRLAVTRERLTATKTKSNQATR